MAKSNKSTDATDQATSKSPINHSPCTEVAGKCRLAAIAAIAEPMPFVAKAYAGQAREYAEQATTLSDGGAKDTRTVATANRWVLAAETAANEESADFRS